MRFGLVRIARTEAYHVSPAHVALSGGGSTEMNFVGSLVANSLNVSGNYSFHFDESLAGPVEQPFYYVTSWTEVHP